MPTHKHIHFILLKFTHVEGSTTPLISVDPEVTLTPRKPRARWAHGSPDTLFPHNLQVSAAALPSFL